MRYLALLLFSLPAFGAVDLATTPGDWPLYRGTTIVSRHASLDACLEAIRALNSPRTYTCRTTVTVVATTAAVVPPPPPPPPVETWTQCAVEYGLCSFTGTRRVRYGAGDTWVVRELAAVNGGVMCGNGVFGDPAFGVEKVCQISGTYTPPPPPPPATGTATVSWNPVTQNTNGTPATIVGYTVRYGTTGLTQSAQVTGTSHTINNLAPGTWQFTVSARTATAESEPAGPVTKVIP